MPPPPHEAEHPVYVRKGAIACKEPTGRSVLLAGDVQRISHGQSMRRREWNPSKGHRVHVFDLYFRSSGLGLAPTHERYHFTAAQRRNRLRVLASGKAQPEALRISPGTLVRSGTLDPGRHVAHELKKDQGAWVHVIQGECTLGRLLLRSGDGVGVRAEPSVSITAREVTELMLIEVSYMVD